MRPHAHRPGPYGDHAEKRAWLQTLFDAGAAHYEWASQLVSFGTARWYRRWALRQAGVRPGMRVLDVASGTGILARAAVDLVGEARNVIALEPSPGMIRAGRADTPAPFVRGLAERLPFRARSFDVVTMGYALRHVEDLVDTFAELRRVLKPGGRLLVLEISRPRTRIGFVMLRVHMEWMVPRLVRWTTRSPDAERMMRYYWETIVECVPPAAIVGALEHAGFTHAARRAYCGIFSEYHGVA